MLIYLINLYSYTTLIKFLLKGLFINFKEKKMTHPKNPNMDRSGKITGKTSTTRSDMLKGKKDKSEIKRDSTIPSKTGGMHTNKR